MIRDDDDIQERALAEWAKRDAVRRGARREARVLVARDVAAHLALYLLCLGLIGLVIVAWAATGDDRFGWAFGLIVAGIVVAYMSGIRGAR